MFEAIYEFLKAHSRTVQGLHAWVASRIDHVLAAVIKRKLGDFSAFASKLTDRLMMYLLSALLVGVFYSVAFYSLRFLWLGYQETYLGRLLGQGESMGYLLADSFFAGTDVAAIFRITGFCALLLLPLLMAGRLLYVNRLFYEGVPGLVTTPLWGLPLAKFFSLQYGGAPLLLMPLVDLRLVQFFLPALLLLHPAMLFVNWLMPELDELYRNPAQFLRRLQIEREIQRATRQS